MKTRFRDVVFLMLWSVLTLAMGVLGLPLLLSRRATQWWGWVWATASLWLLKHVAGIHSHIRGYNNLLPAPAIYASKHQSTWDTLMLYSTLRNPAFVLKRSLYMIPIFGWYLWRTGQIGIDRKAGKRALDQIVKQSQKYGEQKRPIVIFPEGTRRAPGAKPVYKFGVTRVSEATQLRVVPVALNAGKLWPRTPIAKRSGNAVAEFLTAMPPAGTAREPWLKDLENRIENATNVLMKQE